MIYQAKLRLDPLISATQITLRKQNTLLKMLLSQEVMIRNLRFGI